MKVAVTGGAGFIGSHLTGALLASGHSVRVIDNLSTGRRENLGHLEGEFELLDGDVADRGFLRPALTGVEAVFHVAALPSVPRSWSDPLESLRSNALGTSILARTAVDAGAHTIVYSSSSSVYGDQPGECRTEETNPQPISPYAYSKLLGEEVLLAHARAGDLRAVMLRYFNVFGPRQDPTSPYSAVIPIFIKAALRDEPITIYGDGAQSRDFTYVKNVVDANLLALHTTPRCAILNIACGHSISLLELVDAISRLHGAPLDVRHADPRPGDVKHSRADCRLAEQVLGYRPSVTFDAGLQMTYDYYKQN